MKITLTNLLIVLATSGCTNSPTHQGSYERANEASEKAHQRLDSSF